MEKVIKELIEQFHLGNHAFFYLDSIVFQESEANIHISSIELDVTLVAEIASRYDDKITALKLIDNTLPEYLRRKKNKQIECGDFSDLFHAEEILKDDKQLPTLKGLETRIDEYLLKIVTSEPPRDGRSFVAEKRSDLQYKQGLSKEYKE